MTTPEMPTIELLLGDWGGELYRIRKTAGPGGTELSQYRLAALSGVDTRHIDRIERGLVNAGDLNRLAIAGALGVEVADIWKYPPAPRPGESFETEAEPTEASQR